MYSKKVIVLFTLLVYLVLPGCSTKEKRDKISLTYLVGTAANISDVIFKVVGDYEKENLHINIITVPYRDYFTKVKVMVAGGANLDIVDIRATEFPIFCKKDMVLNLESFVENNPPEYMNDYYPQLLEMFRYNGNLYALGHTLDVFALLFNKKLFDEAGIKYPDITWTWQTLLSAGQKMTKDTDGNRRIDQFGFGGLPKWNWMRMAILTWGNGAGLVDEIDKPTKYLMNQPEAIEAIQFAVDLIVRHHIAPSSLDRDTMGEYALFLSGKMAMILEGPWMIHYFNENKNLEWDVAPLPKWKNKVNVASSSGFAVVRSSKNPKEAYNFIKYLASPKVQRLFLEIGEDQPGFRSQEKLFKLLHNRPEHVETFVDEMKYAKLLPKLTNWEKIESVVGREMDIAFLGKKTVEEICRKVTPMVDELLNE